MARNNKGAKSSQGSKRAKASKRAGSQARSKKLPSALLPELLLKEVLLKRPKLASESKLRRLVERAKIITLTTKQLSPRRLSQFFFQETVNSSASSSAGSELLAR